MKLSRNIQYLVAGQFISVFGGAILRFSLSLYMLDITGRADVFATILALMNLPILLSPIGGVIADRYDRRLLMILMDISNAVFSILLLFTLGGKMGNIILITILLMILSFIGNFDTPVVVASIPLLVKDRDLEKVNGMVNGIVALSNIIAPIIGGVLYGIIGVHLMIISSSAIFLIAAVIESRIKIPKVPKINSNSTTIFSELKEGFSEIKSNRIISKSIIITVLLNFILTSFCIVGVPTILRVTLNSNDALYGIGMAAVSGSTIFGAILSGKVSRYMSLKKIYKILGVMFLLTVVMNFGLNFLPVKFKYPIFLITIIPLGAIASTISIYLSSMIQRATNKKSLGRVMSTAVALSQCALPLGQLIIGVLLQNVGKTLFEPLLFINVILLGIVILSKRMFSNITI